MTMYVAHNKLTIDRKLVGEGLLGSLYNNIIVQTPKQTAVCCKTEFPNSKGNLKYSSISINKMSKILQ